MGGGGRAVDQLARAEWRKSSLSTTNGCVEVAFVDDKVAVDGSMDRQMSGTSSLSLPPIDAFADSQREPTPR